MDNYLIDTSILIACLRGYENEINLVSSLLEKGSTLGCCSIIITEIYAGLRKKEKNRTEEFIDSLKFYPVTRDIAKFAGEYIQNYRQKGITLCLADATIGAVTKAYKLKLLTSNKRHYPMIFK